MFSLTNSTSPFSHFSWAPCKSLCAWSLTALPQDSAPCKSLCWKHSQQYSLSLCQVVYGATLTWCLRLSPAWFSIESLLCWGPSPTASAADWCPSEPGNGSPSHSPPSKPFLVAPPRLNVAAFHEDQVHHEGQGLFLGQSLQGWVSLWEEAVCVGVRKEEQHLRKDGKIPRQVVYTGSMLIPPM